MVTSTRPWPEPLSVATPVYMRPLSRGMRFIWYVVAQPPSNSAATAMVAILMRAPFVVARFPFSLPHAGADALAGDTDGGRLRLRLQLDFHLHVEAVAREGPGDALRLRAVAHDLVAHRAGGALEIRDLARRVLLHAHLG